MSDSMLIVSALERELAFIRKSGRDGFLFCTTGEGPANARKELRSFLERQTASSVIGIGFAGGLSNSLQPGDLVVGVRITGEFETLASPILLQSASGSAIDRMHFGVIVTTPAVLWRADEKRECAAKLSQEEIGCVDMESSALAQVCEEMGLQFLAVRAIADLLDEDLPLDFNRCRDENGRIKNARVLAECLRRPSALPGLMKLRRRSLLCASRLAEFVLKLPKDES